jgi:hypothetical protein
MAALSELMTVIEIRCSILKDNGSNHVWLAVDPGNNRSFRK